VVEVVGLVQVEIVDMDHQVEVDLDQVVDTVEVEVMDQVVEQVQVAGHSTQFSKLEEMVVDAVETSGRDGLQILHVDQVMVDLDVVHQEAPLVAGVVAHLVVDLEVAPHMVALVEDVSQFHNNNVELFRSNSVEMFQDRNVQLSIRQNVQMCQNNNVEMFRNNNVRVFQDRNVQMCQDNNVLSNVNQLHGAKFVTKNNFNFLLFLL